MRTSRPEKLCESRQKHAMGYTLLSDGEVNAAKAFGIAFRLDGETLKTCLGYGIVPTDGIIRQAV